MRPSLKKSYPLFSSNPPLKVEVLSNPTFLKIWLEVQPLLQKGEWGCTLLSLWNRLQITNGVSQLNQRINLDCFDYTNVITQWQQCFISKQRCYIIEKHWIFSDFVTVIFYIYWTFWQKYQSPPFDACDQMRTCQHTCHYFDVYKK